eukprot:1096738-Amphidinium_carterae.1
MLFYLLAEMHLTCKSHEDSSILAMPRHYGTATRCRHGCVALPSPGLLHPVGSHLSIPPSECKYETSKRNEPDEDETYYIVDAKTNAIGP